MGKVNEDNDGKILVDENDEEILFDNKTYWRLIEVYGGVSRIVLILSLAFGIAILNVKFDHILTTFISSPEAQNKYFVKYLI